jgi:hypothetical protein
MILLIQVTDRSYTKIVFLKDEIHPPSLAIMYGAAAGEVSGGTTVA